jgi:hypothetical protein
LFVRETAFSFRVLYTKCLLESTKAVANRGNVTGTDMGRRAQGMGMSLHWGAWQGATLPGTYVQKKGVETVTSLHRGPIGMHGGGVRSPGNLRDS